MQRLSARAWLARDGLILLALLGVLLVIFWQVTLGGRSLVPFDTLYSVPPYSAFAAQQAVGPPHNGLVTDLLFQNYAWKSFIRRQLEAGEVPLWNPHLFAGVPFLAAGQHSLLFPLSVLYLWLPLWLAYGWFTVLVTWLAGVGAYLFARQLGLPRGGAAASALTFALGQIFLINPVHPMILAGMACLPYTLIAVEGLLRRVGSGEGLTVRVMLLALLGAASVALTFFAGHIEIALYSLIVVAYYTVARLVMASPPFVPPLAGGEETPPPRPRGGTGWGLSLRAGLVVAGVVLLGLALAATQIVPLFELVSRNYRAGATTLAEARDYAFPLRHILKFVMPDVFGNPAHHGYYDIFAGAWVSDLRNAAGESVSSLAWGIKNYVEGAVYAGLLPLLLAAVALWDAATTNHRPRTTANAPGDRSSVVGRRGFVALFALLALVSLLFAFGTPLYALLYVLPGFSQLHTPFRWVFPYAFSLAMLTGFGWAAIPRCRAFTRALGWVAAALGGLTLLGVGIGYLLRDRLLPVGDRLVARLAKASDAFSGGAAFLSYEGRVVLLFGVFLGVSGLALVALAWGYRRQGGSATRSRLVQVVALGVLAVDLAVAAWGFNPATNPKLADFLPPAVTWLQARQAEEGPFRITALGDKALLAPNLALILGLEDLRGYDSIIPRQYVDMARQIGDQDLLLYNQIAPPRKADSLDSPLLDLLGVRYVLSSRSIDRPGWTLAYDGEVKIYRNEAALPRAFFADAVSGRAPITVADDPAAAALATAPGGAGDRVSIAHRTANGLDLDVTRSGGDGLLVVAESYFPGWQAYLAPADGSAPEQTTPILRVSDNFRGVVVPPGVWRLRMTYSPMSVKVGLYLSFVALATLMFLLGFAGWRRMYGAGHEEDAVRRVGRNSLAPMLTNLGNKVVDFAFAAIMLRILEPTLAGRYYFAIAIIGFVEIWSNFGLNLYLTRHIAQDRSHAEETAGQILSLRLLLLAVALPVLALLGMVWNHFFGLTPDVIAAILLLYVALIPGAVSAALSSVFYAYERMEYPAGLTSLTTLFKVTLGLAVLLAGWGIVGLAGVAVVTNLVTAAILWRAASGLFFRPRLAFERVAAVGILVASFPLMLNHLLQTLFFKVDVTLLQPLQGDEVVGWYSTAYKWVDALLIIPAYFTLAIFPLMSRLATREAATTDGTTTDQSLVSNLQPPSPPLARPYTLALRALLIIALPVAAATTFMSPQLIRLLGGPAYLPHGAIALSIMIWFLPFSFVNGVTQYVLVAVDEAKWITRSFAVAFAFNIVFNLIFIPRYSYPAAAVITILSEIVLMVPFMWAVRRRVGPVNPLALAWRPALASAALAVVFALLWGRGPWLLVLLLAAGVYLGILVAVGGLTAQDRALAKRLLPGRNPVTAQTSSIVALESESQIEI